MAFFSSIFKSARQGELDKIQKFLDKGQSPNDADEDGATPLIHAADGGQLEAVRLLLSRGAEIDRQGRRGDTPLYHAAKGGHVKVVLHLLESGAEPDKCARKGLTPLQAASARGYHTIVEALAARGADIEYVEKHGRTPLFIAVEKGHIALVELLLALGANVEHRGPGGARPLMVAVKSKDPAMVLRLLQRGVDVDARDDEGRSAIQRAALCGGFESMELLASAGADLSQRTRLEGWNLATLARNGNFERVAKRLLELEEEREGLFLPDTLLEVILSGDTGLLRAFLLGRDVDLNAPLDAQGWTPLLAALNKDHFTMAEYLIQRGADANQTNAAGETPLYQALVKGNLPLVRRLLDAGADIRVNCHGLNMREAAKRVGNRPIYEMLKRHAKIMAEAEAS